jgi:hypothetical protein
MARGRKPLGENAMTNVERQLRYQEKRGFERGVIKAKINQLTLQQIRQNRTAQLEHDHAEAIKVALVAYADEPKRLQARLAELRRMVAEFRRHPQTYSMSALFHSDREANLRWLAKR